MNESKWNNHEKTEILDEDFLAALDEEIKKRYPSNTRSQQEQIELLEELELLDNTEILEIDDIEEQIAQKASENTEILEFTEELNSFYDNYYKNPYKPSEHPRFDEEVLEEDDIEFLERTIELLRMDEEQIWKKQREERTEEIKKDENVSKQEKKGPNPLEDTIEILNDRFEELSNASKSLENTIELLKVNPTTGTKPKEEIEFLEEVLDTYEDPTENLENTIELLDIVQPAEPIVVKNKITPKKRPWIILFIICVLLIIFCLGKAFFWQRDSFKTNRQIQNIVASTTTKESIIKQENIIGATTPEDDRYFQYLDVDFHDLTMQNEDVEGWIKVNNTNINYPFVQTTDNEFYLTHSFDKSSNTAGWVFADFRNHFDNLDQNTILYAHGRLDNTMFGSLKKVVEKNWYENMENEFIQISTKDSNTIWQVFSIYTIKPESYYITPNFATELEYQTFLTTIQARSIYDFHVSLSSSDKVLTLSSCYNDTERVVLHAKLVNIQAK